MEANCIGLKYDEAGLQLAIVRSANINTNPFNSADGYSGALFVSETALVYCYISYLLKANRYVRFTAIFHSLCKKLLSTVKPVPTLSQLFGSIKTFIGIFSMF